MKFATTTLAIAALTVGMGGAASASNADFQLVNKTGYQIDSVFVGAHSSDSWGSDIMGKSALADDDSVNIVFPHGGAACMFDIKVKYNDGEEAEWGNVNLCQYEKISLYWKNKTTSAVGE